MRLDKNRRELRLLAFPDGLLVCCEFVREPFGCRDLGCDTVPLVFVVEPGLGCGGTVTHERTTGTQYVPLSRISTESGSS